MEVSVDIEEVEEFVTSDKFRDFILNEQPNFGTAAFILQTLLNAINEVKENMKETK